MNTDASIQVEGFAGLGSNGEGISGIDINYGFNMIPTAFIRLNTPWVQKNAPDLFSGPGAYKKQTKPDKVKIKIKTVTGCMDFEGFFDGLSSQQVTGGMNFTAIIKNKFQILSDMYPKYIGVYPGSTLAYRNISNLSINSGNPAEMYETFLSELDLHVSPTKFYIEAIKKIAESQTNTELWGNTTELSALRKILEGQAYKDGLKQLTTELDNIDVSNADTPDLVCAQSPSYYIDMLMNGGDTAWDLLVNAMGDVGCVLIPSNKKLYVIPQSNFLKLEGSRPGNVQQQAKEANQAFPADYNNFVLNDVSYKNIKYCFVECYDSALVPECSPSSIYADYLGQYPENESDVTPDDGSTGILVVYAPSYLARSALSGIAMHNDKVRDGIEGGKAWPDTGEKAPITPDAAAAGMDAIDQKVDQTIGSGANDIKKTMDKYAKARFLQEKYVERTGSFTTQFNPQWVPGTTGFLACQSPCLVYNFYVTSVRHSLSTSDARSGSATTEITFNAARWGSTVGQLPSVESNELYGYDSGKMQAFQKSWLGDNQAKFSSRS